MASTHLRIWRGRSGIRMLEGVCRAATRWSLLFAWMLAAQDASALPIGFGTNQGGLEYGEIVEDGKFLYFDRRAPGEAQHFSAVIDRYRPLYEQWMGRKREEPLHVISSAATSNASFANFLTDTIELQTLGQGDRDLLLHEMTHNYMYEHFHNFLGPAGSIIYLPWLPAWWIEGLAEAFSVSAGSDVAATVEREMAISGKWPTFDRLHSLYHSKVAASGYPLAGNLVSYILRRLGAADLGGVLSDARAYAEPWWWPWTVVPFNDFLPLDAVLQERLGRTSSELYEDYKADARAYWAQRGDLVGLEKGKAPFIHSSAKGLYSLESVLTRNGTGYVANFVAGRYVEQPITYSWIGGKPKKPAKPKVTMVFPDHPRGFARSAGAEFRFSVARRMETLTGRSQSEIVFQKKGKTAVAPFLEDAFIEAIWEAEGRAFFSIRQPDLTSICYAQLSWFEAALRSGKGKGTPPGLECPVQARQPWTVELLGTSVAGKEGAVAWISLAKRSAAGDFFEVHALNLKTLVQRKVHATLARPLGAVLTGDGLVLLQAERSRQSLFAIDLQSGLCRKALPLRERGVKLYEISLRQFLLGLQTQDSRYDLHMVNAEELPWQDCYRPAGHVSPLLLAARDSKAMTSLAAALAAADTRRSGPALRPASGSGAARNPDDGEEALLAALAVEAARDEAANPQAAGGLSGSQTPLEAGKDKAGTESAPARWRGEPEFIFPWIGAEDVYGTQLGIVSVPLMDHLQNEQVRLTALYGVESQYPSVDLALVSTRFHPTVTVSAFRQQSYNGSYYGDLLYYDEKGLRYSLEQPFYFLSHRQEARFYGKSSHLSPYLGPGGVNQGRLNEVGAGWGLSARGNVLGFSTSIDALAAPAGINNEFDYNRLSANVDFFFPLPLVPGNFNLGLEGARTRGEARKFLMEVYRPLKTFVPGSGGGYNKNNFLVAGPGSMFNALFGDTLMRGKANYTVPVVKDLDKQIWILYFERLDFTAFYNYGGAWFGAQPPAARLVSAHGYNLDLQLENKGVRFNVGGGIGQVVGRDFDFYLTSGFDALF